MKLGMKSAAALAALTAAAPAAYATDGWYGRVDVGYSFTGDFDISDDGVYDYGAPEMENDWVESLGL
ncbi:MAG: hypothetical protein GC206_10500, partial [Alphaproteobacteria bacterium]|nr:hypothetical protein [Alphaproteobacteria bacterium]